MTNIIGVSLSLKEIEVLQQYGFDDTDLSVMQLLMVGSNSVARKYYDKSDGDRRLYQDPGDAYRHAYWSAALTLIFGEPFARDFTTAHETQFPTDPDPRENSFMDMYNNEVGIQIALSNPDTNLDNLEALVYQALTEGSLVVWDGNDIYYSNDCPYCNY